MLKACQYCGRIHAKGYDCGKKPKRNRQQAETEAALFRSSWQWTKKSLEIRERDNYLCQICLRGKYNAQRMLQWDDVSVHHIIPVAANKELSMENTNLITLCSYHHEMAEAGKIPISELCEIARQQEEAWEA